MLRRRLYDAFSWTVMPLGILIVCLSISQICSGQERATPLLQAAEVGNLTLVQRLLAEGSEIDARNADMRTPLIVASAAGHYEVVLVLLRGGASVNARAGNGKTALQMATQKGHSKIVKLLEAYGAKK